MRDKENVPPPGVVVEVAEPVETTAPGNPVAEGPGALVSKVVRGAAALSIRQVMVQGLNVGGGVLLARILVPGEFGLYGVIVFILAFLVAFGDVGLGASLVRQPEEPDTSDYRAVFTIQQALVILVVACFWVVAPWVARSYQRPGDVWLFRVVALALIPTSFQSLAALRLERHLAFGKLAVIEVAQAVVFNGLAVGLAWAGFGALGVAVALLARAVVGALLANQISPWPIGLLWDWPRVRSHLRFGLPYQGVYFVSLLKDSITPVLIGFLLGAAEVGYVNWAGMVAAYPVMALMVLQRLYLPAFSRMREHPAELSRFVERVLWATNGLVAPLAILTLVLVDPVTRLVFGAKWLPALPYFYLLWAANVFVPTATPLLGLLNALGRSSLAFRFALLWMVGTWLLGAPLILRFGAIGFALANVGVQLTNLLLFRVVRARVKFRIVPVIYQGWLVAAAMGGAIAWLARHYPPYDLMHLIVFFVSGGVVYLVSMAILNPTVVRRIVIRTGGERWVRASR